MEIGRNYRILVESYMTKKSTPDFDFMERFNHNVPMPSTIMTGKLLQDFPKMIKMELQENGKRWAGLIPKSAIKKTVDLEGPVLECPVRVSIGYGKTVLDIGTNLEVKERITFLLKRFAPLEIINNKLFFQALDFEDICKELKELKLQVQEYPGNYFDHYLVEQNTPMIDDVPDPQSLTKTALYEYQKEGIRYGLQHKSFLLGDDMGLGKTLQASLIAVGKKQMFGFKHCLVVCGVNSVKYNWVREIEKHTGESGFVLADLTSKKITQLQCLERRLYLDSELEQMKVRERKKAEESNAINKAYFIIVNIEAFRNKDFSNKIKTLCNTGHIGGMIFDEIHTCVNANSQQSKGILEIPAAFKIGMTGTPLINKPTDSFFTFRWLEKTKKNLYQWNHVYQRKISQYEYENRNLGLLQKNFARIMLRRKKEDVLDLPDKIYMEELIEMKPEQAELYRNIQADLLQEQKLLTLTKILRLRQTTGAPVIAANAFSGGAPYSEAVSAKLERLSELVQEIISSGKKVVIFSNWKEVLDILPEYGIPTSLRIDGDTTATERTEIEQLWQSEPEGLNVEHPVLVGTLKVMGTGLNLNSATTVIFIDEPWTNTQKEQAVDRCYRIGTKDTVNVITLLCHDTVDEEVHEVVLGKKTMAQVLVDYGESNQAAKQMENLSEEERNLIEGLQLEDEELTTLFS